MAKVSSIDSYIAALPASVQVIARDLRRTIIAAAPGASEAIKYDMPAFQIGSTTLLYFACWKQHVGLYPIYKGDDAFEAEIAPFRAKKDTVQFRYAEPIPKKLIVKIVQSQLAKVR